MDTAGGPVTVPTIVAANRTASSNVIINANQSSSHQHHHHNSLTQHSNSSNSSNNSIISNNGGGSGSGSSNSSSSSSSTSSNSSGYGSTSATPTNSYETHTAATTPVAIAEPIIPVATVAAVSPFYSEALTTQSLESQLYSQNQQQHHQQQHHPQHLQQQYYSTYDYTEQQHQQPLQHQPPQQHLPQQQQQQQQQLIQNLSSTYNMVSGSGSQAFDGASAPSATTGLGYQQGAGHQYKATGVASVNYERHLSGRSGPSGVTAATAPVSYQQNETTPKPTPTHPHHHQQFLGVSGSSSKSRTSNSLLGSSSSSSTSTKPQAAATPFYAQPLSQQQSSNPSSFYDGLKHKMPLDYHDNFANFPNAAFQQQKYYAAAKSQLKEAASYGSHPGLAGKSLYHNTNNFYAGGSAQHAGSLPTAGYDKYMYPTAYPTLGYEASPETTYRKTGTSSSLNSSSWPWGIDYASGNSRTIPPPTGHLPTATVAPTHASYLTANTSHLSRDPYYMAHDKYGMKYDKYSPPYQQAYVSPPSTRHHLWPGTHSPLNERLAPPPPHGLHTASPYFQANAPAALNARQSCCSQPYQPQSCYYPPPGRLPHGQPSTAMGQSSAYMTPQPPAHHQTHLNPLSSSCKYGSVMDYGTASKLKTPNDLYLSSHYDANPPPPHLAHPHSYQYGSAAAAAAAAANNQLYNSNQIHHGQQPAGPLIAHDPLANSASYTNDLSLSSNTYDTHLHEHPSHVNPQSLGIPSGPTMAPAPGYVPTAAKRALLDYRKPIQPQPPPPPQAQEQCYVQEPQASVVASAPRDHYHQSTDLLNTPETTTTFNDYDTQSQASGFTPDENAGETVPKSGEEVTKNLSLRDFIANWNEDEDDYAAANTTEDMTFAQSTVLNEVLQTSKTDPPSSMDQIPPLISDKVREVESVSKVAEITKHFVDSPLSEVDANQYVNLPDIVIDIEKSNVNISSSISTPPSTDHVVDPNSLTLDNFDVEKELDQLQQMRKSENDSVIVKPNHQPDGDTTKDTKIVIKSNSDEQPKTRDNDHHNHAKSLTTQISFDDLNLEQTKTVLPTRPTNTSTTNIADSVVPKPAASSEQYFKDMEGYDSCNSHHSNESSLFEKEYETFINKITSGSESVIKPETETATEFEQNVQDFSKFYKRKRKLKDEEAKSPQSSKQQNRKKIKSNDDETNVNNSNFPQVYTKKSRNRQEPLMKHSKPRTVVQRRKPSSFYYKLVQSLRRYRLGRGKRVRDYIAELKEKHLPLIKRQSIKNYSIGMSSQVSRCSPLSLKTLVLMVINSEEFRERLMITAEEYPETEEKHICVDPSCETCEVIRSLMEPETLEDPILEECPKHNLETVELSSFPAVQISDLTTEALNALNSTKMVFAEVISQDLDNTVLLQAIGSPSGLYPTSSEPAEKTESKTEIELKLAPKDDQSPVSVFESPVLNVQNLEQHSLGVIMKTNAMESNEAQLLSNTNMVSKEAKYVTDSQNSTELSKVIQGTVHASTTEGRGAATSDVGMNNPNNGVQASTVIRKHARNSTERDDDFEPKRICKTLDGNQEALRSREPVERSINTNSPANVSDAMQITTVIRKIGSTSKEVREHSSNMGSQKESDTHDYTTDMEDKNLLKTQLAREFSPNLQNTAETTAACLSPENKLAQQIKGEVAKELTDSQTDNDSIVQTTAVIRKHETKIKGADDDIECLKSKAEFNIREENSTESKAESDDDDEDSGESDTDSSSCSSSCSSDDEEKDCDGTQDSSESDSENENENETLKILIKEVEKCEKRSQFIDAENVPQTVQNDNSPSDNAKEASTTSLSDNENETEAEAEIGTKDEKAEKSLHSEDELSKTGDFAENETRIVNLEGESVTTKDAEDKLISKLDKSDSMSSSDSSDETDDENDGEQNVSTTRRQAIVHNDLDSEIPKSPTTPAACLQDFPIRPDIFDDCSKEGSSYRTGENLEQTSSLSSSVELSESPKASDLHDLLSEPIDRDEVFKDLQNLSPQTPHNVVPKEESLEQSLTPENAVKDLSDEKDLESPASNAAHHMELSLKSPLNTAAKDVLMSNSFPKSPANNKSPDMDAEKSPPESPAHEGVDKISMDSSTNNVCETPDGTIFSPKAKDSNDGEAITCPEDYPPHTPPNEDHAEDTTEEDIIDLSEDTSSSEDESEHDESDNESPDLPPYEEPPTNTLPKYKATQIVDITEDSTSNEDSDFDEDENSHEFSVPERSNNLENGSDESRSSIEMNSDDSDFENEDEYEVNSIKAVETQSVDISNGCSNENEVENIGLEKDIVVVLRKEGQFYKSRIRNKSTSTVSDQENSTDVPQETNHSKPSPGGPIENSENSNGIGNPISPEEAESLQHKEEQRCPVIEESLEIPEENNKSSSQVMDDALEYGETSIRRTTEPSPMADDDDKESTSKDCTKDLKDESKENVLDLERTTFLSPEVLNSQSPEDTIENMTKDGNDERQPESEGGFVPTEVMENKVKEEENPLLDISKELEANALTATSSDFPQSEQHMDPISEDGKKEESVQSQDLNPIVSVKSKLEDEESLNYPDEEDGPHEENSNAENSEDLKPILTDQSSMETSLNKLKDLEYPNEESAVQKDIIEQATPSPNSKLILSDQENQEIQETSEEFRTTEPVDGKPVEATEYCLTPAAKLHVNDEKFEASSDKENDKTKIEDHSHLELQSSPAVSDGFGNEILDLSKDSKSFEQIEKDTNPDCKDVLSDEEQSPANKTPCQTPPLVSEMQNEASNEALLSHQDSPLTPEEDVTATEEILPLPDAVTLTDEPELKDSFPQSAELTPLKEEVPLPETPGNSSESLIKDSPQSPAIEESRPKLTAIPNDIYETLPKDSPQPPKIKEQTETYGEEVTAPISKSLEDSSVNHPKCLKKDFPQSEASDETTIPQISEKHPEKDDALREEYPEARSLKDVPDTLTDSLQSSFPSDERSKDSCHYSSTSSSCSADEEDISKNWNTSENSESCEVSLETWTHLRTLPREASPEMNFWNTKGKYHSLKNYKANVSKSPGISQNAESLQRDECSDRLESMTSSSAVPLNSESVLVDVVATTSSHLNLCTDHSNEEQHSTTVENGMKIASADLSLENSKIEPPLDHSEMSTLLAEDKTMDDVSADFLGFKNQSSFDDASEDFHGFEDQYEEERIRREIENLNEDSTANDAFPCATQTSLTLKSSAHSADSMSSDLDELEALEKELSQHRLVQDLGGSAADNVDEEDLETEPHLVSVSNAIISTNDIEHIKKMLESDEEQVIDEPDNRQMHKERKEENAKENIRATNISIIPKLSDLCRAALNSSLNVNNLPIVQNNDEVRIEEDKEKVKVATTTTTTTTSDSLNKTPNVSLETCTNPNTVLVERELSVEEALAEMYRQAGVLLSDPEDNDTEKTLNSTATTTTTIGATAAATVPAAAAAAEHEEAQDVLLINLHEILNSDNDVYVLQCDMNINDVNDNNDDEVNGNGNGNCNADNHNDVINAVEGNGNAINSNSTGRVNTLQLIGILNTDSENSEIHIISSDSESEVIILSDYDTDAEFQAPATRPSARKPSSPRDYIPFINDLDTSDSLSDLSTIHHEEIVPDNLHKFLQLEFYKYLHEKYAQKKLSKYYHANRVLRKYKKRVSHKFRQ